MAQFDLNYIRTTLNPAAVPANTDLIFAFKADGTPAAYTLSELANYVQGVSTPLWLTDAANGALIRINQMGPQPQVDGVIAFNTVVRDGGWYDGNAGYIVPTGVTKCECVCGVRTSNPNAQIQIIKNLDTANPIVTVIGSGGYALAVTPEIDVSATDTLFVYITGAGNIYTGSDTFFSVRATEKLV